ncbi:hypothetical protein WJX72_012391 [[Myrmecia] bisecta]|uniref:Peptidase S49 domain-containing protein n=1 Tax=[Myrmecia] bisecta TaxID=41462 RepID=A0AAW1QT97_9CHLO
MALQAVRDSRRCACAVITQAETKTVSVASSQVFCTAAAEWQVPANVVKDIWPVFVESVLQLSHPVTSPEAAGVTVTAQQAEPGAQGPTTWEVTCVKLKPGTTSTYMLRVTLPYYIGPVRLSTVASIAGNDGSVFPAMAPLDFSRPVSAVYHGNHVGYRSAGRSVHSRAVVQSGVSPHVADQQATDQPISKPQAQPEQGEAAGDSADNGAGPLPSGDLVYEAPSALDRFWTSLKLLRALPWRRFKKGSVLVLELSGSITEQRQGRFGSATSMPQICEALQKAAYDPRIVGIYIKLAPLSAGWAKLQELRQYIGHFCQSGKFAVCYMTTASEKEYFLASACQEVYMPSTAQLSLRGFAVSGTFLRGVLDKVGVEPQVKRIGEYKSAGDQLLRKDMASAQREQLTALLGDIHDNFTATIAHARNKTVQEVEELLDAGLYDMEKVAAGGWLTGLRYEDEILEDLKKRTGGKPDKLRGVSLKKYASVNPSAFGLVGRKMIAVIRTAGAIVGGSQGPSSTVTADAVIKQLRAVGKDKSFVAVVLRVDSPGGDALASDLMWREIQQLAKKKPVIASMGDVAASGGYYLAMAANKIIAEPLTITGSIGVVTGKFNLSELYRKVGYSKEVISRGKYAELLNDSRPFTEEEEQYFSASAQFAYESFRDKAAHSRGMAVEDMQKVAQGRVWSGQRALQVKLVDGLGGMSRAIAVAKQAADIDAKEAVRVVELSKAKPSPLALVGGGASLGPVGAMQVLVQLILQPRSLLVGLAHGLGMPDALLLNPGRPAALMPPLDLTTSSGGSLGVLGVLAD